MVIFLHLQTLLSVAQVALFSASKMSVLRFEGGDLVSCPVSTFLMFWCTGVNVGYGCDP